MLKVGDFIQCRDKQDCENHLRILREEGYGAVVTDPSYTLIRITSVTEAEADRRNEGKVRTD